VIGSRRHLLRAACTGTTLVTAEQEALPALIAGIYGMNLQGIPMTKLSHGYFIVIVFMAAVVLGHFWFFYRRGWFK